MFAIHTNLYDTDISYRHLLYVQHLTGVDAIIITIGFFLFDISDGFDIVVNDCYAHNGAQKKIQLIDQYG